jgi:rhodanese-related sulfurtransferase
MKAVFLAICISAAAFNAAASEYAGDSYVIDQRDPKYQTAIEHLASAAQALRLAQDELKKAEASHPLPGLDLVRMLSQVRPVEETINVVLRPEKKRLRYQELTPDGQFFTTPPRLGD